MRVTWPVVVDNSPVPNRLQVLRLSHRVVSGSISSSYRIQVVSNGHGHVGYKLEQHPNDETSGPAEASEGEGTSVIRRWEA